MIRLFNFAEIRFCVLPHRTPSNIMTSQIPFSELKAGWCRQFVETRLLRFCEAQNVKKGGERMAVDMLLIDGELSRFIIPVITLRFWAIDVNISWKKNRLMNSMFLMLQETARASSLVMPQLLLDSQTKPYSWRFRNSWTCSAWEFPIPQLRITHGASQYEQWSARLVNLIIP